MSDFTLIDQAGSELSNMTKEGQGRYERICRDIFITLGGSTIDVDLEDEDFEVAFRTTVDTYRQVSSRSVYECYGMMTLFAGVQQYVLNERVDNVRRIFRNRGFSTTGLGTNTFDPISAAFMQGILRGGGSGIGGAPGSAGDLVTYFLSMQQLNLLEKLFARDMNFTFRNETHTLQLLAYPQANEIVAVHCSVIKTYDELLKDHFATKFIRDYMLASCRIIWGEKLTMFTSLPGAQGGVQTKGSELKQQGIQDQEKLINSLLENDDAGMIAFPSRG